ncbi:alpha/beta fold hydrolase [Microbacterium sp. MPKO10]|uniref:alpha/beta fold hydrolase n=1 Tax=Microbacterium sp. MPKO10 TaxID=2989818 RepID=UPI002235E998|nr:alpha/beta fold hydrolase [Microbacterium sp. MPKO10]MCW4457619.1 alpha/beta fold hydrolase [Microbacterium sp. MPKO10]
MVSSPSAQEHVAARAASLPPSGLPGLDLASSHLIDVPGRGIDEGAVRTWHYLDNADELADRGVTPRGTILAVHGNPTWSYLWRQIVAQSGGDRPWRVVAVDQLEMGFSERTGRHRTLSQRITDLSAFTEALGLTGSVVTLGHDWGGVISLGWATRHPELLAGVALLNTAVHQPGDAPVPAPLRLARARGVLATATAQTNAFLDVTLSLAHPRLSAAVAAAYREPYLTADRRSGIEGFVRDIPVDTRHESHAALEAVADGVSQLTVPALLLWGPRDPIFSDRYLADLIERLPHAHVHRFEGAGHLLAEDAPYAPAVLDWVTEHVDEVQRADQAKHAAEAEHAAVAEHADTAGYSDGAATTAENPDAAADAARARFVPLWNQLDAHSDDPSLAVTDMTAPGEPLRVSWAQLSTRVRQLAAGLHSIGVRPGDRVSLLVQPGPTLTAVIYACLRIGAVVVVADAGLGVRGLSRAIAGARPDILIGDARALSAARLLGWPGRRISTAALPRPVAAALGVAHTLGDLAARGRDTRLPAEPSADAEAAVLFTSGSTGPAKGVVYTHAQLSAMRDTIAGHFAVTPETGLVTGFAPFALLGPALGTRSVTPAMNISSPRTLTAQAVAAAVRASNARIVFLSPASILNVVATSGELSDDDRAALATVRTFLSTGAPISERLLSAAAELMPNATAHTPYGMTECLLVTDITREGISEVQDAADRGVCVGTPMGGNRVLISALDSAGNAAGTASDAPGVLGEILVSAPHLKQKYDRLWLTDRRATRDVPENGRWHRTGDIGHLDAEGRLWVEGRLQHVIVTAEGPVAPVGPEQDLERVAEVRRAAVVGIGPEGLRQAVAVIETMDGTRRPRFVEPGLAARLRASTALPLAAVFEVQRLPTDIRHNSKIDRSRLSVWAERMLSGERLVAP